MNDYNKTTLHCSRFKEKSIILMRTNVFEPECSYSNRKNSIKKSWIIITIRCRCGGDTSLASSSRPSDEQQRVNIAD